MPLSDIRIIALEQYGAGPFGSLQLAHLGAEVVKIEEPSMGGDSGRYTPTYSEGEDSLFFESRNFNKKSISLEIRSSEGRSVFEDLVRQSDAVYYNLRGDVPAKLRIRYSDLRHVNPQIVCCSLSGFGMTGPRKADPAYDYVLQALAGWMALTGDPAGPPEKTGLSLVDCSGGFAAAISLLAGIHAARRDGVGMDCDVSLYDTAVSLLGYHAAWHLTAGYQPQRTTRSAHPTLVPCQTFPAKDGWIVVMCPKEKFWQRLTTAIGQPQLASDPRFVELADRAAHRSELEELLDDAFSTRTVAEWIEKLRSASVPCAPVNSVEQALTDEHTLARGLIAATNHPRFGTVKQVIPPVRVGTRPRQHRRAPLRGEHTQMILRDLLGYDDSTVVRLQNAGVFGSQAGR